MEIGTAGFISGRDLQARRDLLLSRRQQLAQLEQLRASKASALRTARRSAEQAAADRTSRFAELHSSQAELDQKLTGTQASRGYEIKAPVAGKVSGVTAVAGDYVSAGRSLLAIVPGNYALEAELSVPTASAGFLSAGQEVRITVDAFSQRRHGTLSGRVKEIGALPVSDDGHDHEDAAYRVVVGIPPEAARRFAGGRGLKPGMAITGRIVTERESLFIWLFGRLLGNDRP